MTISLKKTQSWNEKFSDFEMSLTDSENLAIKTSKIKKTRYRDW